MNVYLFSVNPDASVLDQWDFGFLKDFLDQQPGKRIVAAPYVEENSSGIVVIPARHNVEHINEINDELRKLKHVVLFLLGDEEADFPVEQIDHPSIHIWVQNPHPGKHDAYNKIGTGYPPKLTEWVKDRQPPEKTVDVFFSGQITHPRRLQMWKHINGYDNSDVRQTDGFTKGFKPEEYYERMEAARVAPAPAGAVIPDSFRLYEALELMTVPIADERNSSGTIDGYWEWLFGSTPPFPLIKDWSNARGYTLDVLNDWPNIQHQQTAWWIRYKRNFANKVMEQLHG